MFGLHGKGSLGSKDGDDEVGVDEEEAMMAASLDGELETLELELETPECDLELELDLELEHKQFVRSQ